MTRILILAPYAGLKELAAAVAAEYPAAHLEVHVGNYLNGPELLLRLTAVEHFDAVITRGGTVDACRRVSSIPVIEMAVNAFDMIRVIQLSEGYTGQKALLAYPNIVSSFAQLSELLGYAVPAGSYREHQEVPALVRELRSRGCELVIGDQIVYQTAQELGMSSILLTTGAEAIRSAIEEALRLADALSNQIAAPPIHSPHIAASANSEPFAEDETILITEKNTLSPGAVHTVFPPEVMLQLTEWSDTPLPTIITGEDGMCKNDAGFLCCCFGSAKRKKLVRVNCCLIPADYDFGGLDRLLSKLLEKEELTLFLEDIHQLTVEIQRRLLPVLKRITKDSRVKLLSSSELPVEAAVNTGRLLRQLRPYLDEVRIELKPLAAYAPDIPNMVSMYLAALDVRCGTRAVGIREKGIRLLSEYRWPGNLRQFMRVLNELALGSSGAYIPENHVRHALEQEQNHYAHASLVPMDLTGSLKDIEARIIRHVMEEEGMNQAKVEKRLDISHSTLWRRLK
ncbi:MAG: Fis family transcriptional regulator [Paenibacillaceae bacterium]|jgi:hypothetical protein|nr:Fis family transcriptional regulator [Paenibacillaceae bacterium]